MPRRLTSQARVERIAELAERDGWTCHYCGCGLVAGKRSTTIDEVQPLARGGLPVAGNQVLACYPCNRRKRDMTAAEFAHFLAKGGPPRSYHDWRLELKRRLRAMTDAR